MSGEPERYIRFPEVGSFYAFRNPLCLARVKDLKTGGMGNFYDSVMFDVWLPQHQTDACFIEISSEKADFLWFEKVFEYTTGHLGYDFVTGDVRVSQSSNRLWFVGPDSTDKKIHVLASFSVATQDMTFSNLYQPGPARRQPRCKSSLERIMEDKT